MQDRTREAPVRVQRTTQPAVAPVSTSASTASLGRISGMSVDRSIPARNGIVVT